MATSDSGRCYAKSISSQSDGAFVGTRVFRVRRGQDELVHSFEWFSYSLEIRCPRTEGGREGPITLIRFGRAWGSELGEVQGPVTLAFYRDGKPVAEFSTADLALFSKSRSLFYPRSDPGSGVARVLGFKTIDNRDTFEVCTADGRILLFDISNGDLIDQRPDNLEDDRCMLREHGYYRGSGRYTTIYYDVEVGWWEVQNFVAKPWP